MKRIISTSIFGLFVWITLQSHLHAQIVPLKDYSNKYSAPIGTFQGINFREGGFSGMYMIPGTNGKEFWIVSDRGVNIDAANANSGSCRPTYDKIYAFPNYSPKIHRVRIVGDSVQILQTITIKRPNGTGATGIINPTGFGSTSAEVASTDTVQNCANFNLKIAAKDIWGIDAEGLALDRFGNFWICEEGGPTIWVVSPTGVVLKRYTPYANLPGAQPQDLMIDSCFKYRKNNRGFEGITIAPNGKVYAIIQSPILYPSKSIGEGTRVHRILEIDPVSNATRMFVYLNDGIIGASGADQIRLRDWKIGDMAAINDSTFLVLEAALRGATDIKRMYMINLNGATAVNSGLYGGKTLEALVDSAGLAAQSIKPVRKTLFMNFYNYAWDSKLDKIEGLAIINDSTIAVCNDNDYGQYSALEDGVATATSNLGHVVVYSLKGKNKLPNYTPLKYNFVAGITGPGSSQTPYLSPLAKDVMFTAILSAGDKVGNYTMCGTPDGLGAFDNGNGTFTVVMNHEFGNTAGIVRSHGSKGAFVSKWVINKSDLQVLAGQDLINTVYLWDGTQYVKYDATNPSSLTAFNRFCSADMPPLSAFYNASTGKGTQERIFMNGEEAGSEGRAFAHIVTGANAGVSYELPFLGKFSMENSVANPNASDKTIVIGMDDATPGQVYVYVGNKSNSGNEIQKAGLTGGKLYGIAVNGLQNESSSSIPTPGTGFTLADLGSIENSTGTYINTLSNNLGVTNFLRPEDGLWDPTHPNDFYFATTNAFSSPSRLWRLRFTDINNPELGGTITAVLDGTEGPKMMDNLGIDNFGHILIQEDVGNNAHNGKIYQYDVNSDGLKLIAEHDNNRFIAGGSNYLTQDEESSGVIDVQSILGPGMFLLVDQAHYAISGEVVEGGQLLALFNPESYLSNPEVAVKGNSVEILSGDLTPSLTDNTDFGNVPSAQIKSFVIGNSGQGPLFVSGIDIKGQAAADFTILNPPIWPLQISAGNSYTFNIRFIPAQKGLRTATVTVLSNDADENKYTFAIQGNAIDPGVSGPSSSTSPYLTSLTNGGKFTSILTTGDYINNYRMCGTPDGLGAFDNGNGTFTLLMNHEFGNTAGIPRAHGSAGSFVSKWIINKADLSVISGADLIKTVYLWDGSKYVKYDATNPSALTAFSRFCSADLPEMTAFYNPQTGKGTQNRLFMNGEETGSEGRAFAHIVTGNEAGTTYELPFLGKFSWENSVACPNPSDKTIVIGMDDATPGQVYVYIGSKASTGNDIEKAGLSGGKLFGIAVNGLLNETSSSVPAAGTSFTLADLGQVQNTNGATLNTNSNTKGVTNFLRPEDGTWDPANPNDFYFATTNAFSSPSRLWKLHFTDINNPELGGTITAVLDGTEGQKMMDNVTMDHFGHLLIVEDVGGNIHNGKVWQYDANTDKLKLLGEHDQTRFITGGANFLTIDEEASGILDVQKILGPGMFLLVDQAHYGITGELVEGGQLLAYYNPETYLSNPELEVSGNGEVIRNGSTTAKTFDNTDFGQVKMGQQISQSFVISNTSVGDLILKGITIEGVNASEFTLESLPVFPYKITSGMELTITVKFKPTAIGIRNASLRILNNDVDESSFVYALKGTGFTNSAINNINVSNLNVYPNPSNTQVTVELGLENNSEVKIRMIDLQGKNVMPEMALTLESGEHTLQIPTSEFAEGIYIVEFEINGVINRVRLTVMH